MRGRRDRTYHKHLKRFLAAGIPLAEAERLARTAARGFRPPKHTRRREPRR